MHPRQINGTADANGNGIATLTHGIAGIEWVVSQVATSTNPAGLATVTILVNGLPCTTPVQVASGAAASGDPPIVIGGKDTMTVQWTGAVPNANLFAAVYYDERFGG